jgi:hypothetical protein
MSTAALLEILTDIKSGVDRLLADREERENTTVDKFCEEEGISRSTFYGLGLPVSKVGKRTIVTPETRAAYRQLLAENSTKPR